MDDSGLQSKELQVEVPQRVLPVLEQPVLVVQPPEGGCHLRFLHRNVRIYRFCFLRVSLESKPILLSPCAVVMKQQPP